MQIEGMHGGTLVIEKKPKPGVEFIVQSGESRVRVTVRTDHLQYIINELNRIQYAHYEELE